MDGTTEPLIAVIANPIAGNPTQFAIERVLKAMKLDWRVISFDVQPKNVAAALEGFSVTGMNGVFIDPSLEDEASAWYAEKSDQENLKLDCLFRNDAKEFECSNERQAWIADQIKDSLEAERLWLGQQPFSAGIGLGDPVPAPPESGQIEAAKFVIITDHDNGPVELEVCDWPTSDGTTVVLDLTEGHPDQPSLKKLGYRVLTKSDLYIGKLQRCLTRWTRQPAPLEVIHEAIEEYFGV